MSPEDTVRSSAARDLAGFSGSTAAPRRGRRSFGIMRGLLVPLHGVPQ
jgi:hypothetical protein